MDAHENIDSEMSIETSSTGLSSPTGDTAFSLLRDCGMTLIDSRKAQYHTF